MLGAYDYLTPASSMLPLGLNAHFHLCIFDENFVLYVDAPNNAHCLRNSASREDDLASLWAAHKARGVQSGKGSHECVAICSNTHAMTKSSATKIVRSSPSCVRYSTSPTHHSHTTFSVQTYETARSASRGFEVKRKISAETSSFVLRIVSLHSLASLFGSTRPRIPTLPVLLICSTPAMTS